MKELKGTKTEANLVTAFSGESQARNKYTYFASVAKKEGYEQIALQQKARTTSGLICMHSLPKKLTKKASLNWLQNSEWSEKLRNTMKKDTELC